MATSKRSSKESKLKKILKMPLKILTSARDFYMKGLTEYSDQVCVMSCPAGNLNNMPRSHSVSSTRSNRFDDDYRELLRAASTRSNMSRSRTVAIGRIDEETACDFDEDEDVKAKTDRHVYPRSRSYAVSKLRSNSS
ncbi:hypothetical protein OIU84_030251 [Salix udensis]|uniref:Uncharacterized protein n=1 Tax=Salix udensis TaxID=889485 RepID=A0AAD6P7U6_9ROSI|nr:hypothetical protein OIU84_030251 [Salix udensis]